MSRSETLPSSLNSARVQGRGAGRTHGIFFRWRLVLTAPTNRFSAFATSRSVLVPSNRSSFAVQSRSCGLTGFPRRASKCLSMLSNQCVGLGSRQRIAHVFAPLIDFLASVGMLAKDAERFRSGADRDEGNSGAPKPSSQRKRERLRLTRGGSSGCAEKQAEPKRSQRRPVAKRSTRWSRRHDKPQLSLRAWAKIRTTWIWQFPFRNMQF